MNILITGANGFLGKSLLSKIKINNSSIFGLVRRKSHINTPKNKLIKVLSYTSDSEFKMAIKKANPDVVINTVCSYGRNDEDLLTITKSNITFGQILLQELIKLNKKITFINTDTALSKETNLYSFTKNQFTDWCKYIIENHCIQKKLIQFINIRLQHMYGPGDDISKFTSYIIHSCFNNKKQIKLTSGIQSRDFLFIDDVVDAYAAILENRESFGKINDIDVGSGKAIKIKTFVKLVHELTNSTSSLLFNAIPLRSNETLHCKANISLLNSLGWKQKISLTEGIKLTIKKDFNT